MSRKIVSVFKPIIGQEVAAVGSIGSGRVTT